MHESIPGLENRPRNCTDRPQIWLCYLVHPKWIFFMAHSLHTQQGRACALFSNLPLLLPSLPWYSLWHVCMLSHFSRVWLFVTLWTEAHQPSDHGTLQARILEWVAMSSSRGSSWPRDWTHVSSVSCIGCCVLYHQCHLGSRTKWLQLCECAMLSYPQAFEHAAASFCLNLPLSPLFAGLTSILILDLILHPTSPRKPLLDIPTVPCADSCTNIRTLFQHCKFSYLPLQ